MIGHNQGYGPIGVMNSFKAVLYETECKAS